MKLTIRTLLTGWVGFGAVVVGIMAASGIWSTTRIQHNLMDTALPLEEVSRGMGLAISKFLVRQGHILAAHSHEELAATPERSALEHDFETQQSNLLNVLTQKSTSGLAEKLDVAYRTFKTTDDRLLSAVMERQTLHDELVKQTNALDDQVIRIQGLAETISGQINFELSRTQRNIRRFVTALEKSDAADPEAALAEHRRLRQMVAESMFGSTTDMQQASTAIRASAEALATLSRKLVLEGNPDLLVSLRANQISQQLQVIRGALDTLQKGVSASAEQTATVENLRTSLDLLVQILLEAPNSVYELRVRSLQAQAQMDEVLDFVRKTSNEILQELSTVVAELRNETETSAKQIALTSRTAILVLCGVVVLATVLLGLLVMRRITKPLTQAGSVLAAATHGDLTQRMDASGGDEFAILARDFNNFAERTQATVKEIRGYSAELADAAQSLATLTEQASHGTARQQQDTAQAATAMHEMNGSVQEITRSVVKAAGQAEQANREALVGKQVVSESVATINHLAATVHEANEVVSRVEEDSRSIGTVLDVIRAIAEQTNLLALNAAIEAARAGEQGRGFAVVADEIRTLAGRTHKSTGEIANMIERLRAVSSQAVSAMDRGSKCSEEGVQKITTAGEMLERIAAAVGEITNMTNQIASAGEEQTAVTEEIGHNIQSINAVTCETARAAEQIAASSEQLAHLAQQLQRQVGGFTV